jgi:hypothetical protein
MFIAPAREARAKGEAGRACQPLLLNIATMPMTIEGNLLYGIICG